jgi:hypothetical protein
MTMEMAVLGLPRLLLGHLLFLKNPYFMIQGMTGATGIMTSTFNAPNLMMIVLCPGSPQKKMTCVCGAWNVLVGEMVDGCIVWTATAFITVPEILLQHL